MSYVQMCRTKGSDWDYNFILPANEFDLTGFSDWYQLHTKLDYSSGRNIQTIKISSSNFYCIAEQFPSESKDRQGRVIWIYSALVSRLESDLCNINQKDLDKIKTKLISAQIECHNLSIDSLDKYCLGLSSTLNQNPSTKPHKRNIKILGLLLFFASVVTVFFSAGIHD